MTANVGFLRGYGSGREVTWFDDVLGTVMQVLSEGVSPELHWARRRLFQEEGGMVVRCAFTRPARGCDGVAVSVVVVWWES